MRLLSGGNAAPLVLKKGGSARYQELDREVTTATDDFVLVKFIFEKKQIFWTASGALERDT